jgi:hypothetical protein
MVFDDLESLVAVFEAGLMNRDVKVANDRSI